MEGADRFCAPCRRSLSEIPPEERVQEDVPGCVFVASVCAYAEPVRDLLVRAKYGGEPHPLTALGDVLAGLAPPASKLGWPDVVVPIPLSRKARRSRGYNQAAILAEPLARRFQLPIQPWRLARCGGAVPQTGLSGEARRRNLARAFRSPMRQHHRVLLVDDVITTGSTLSAAAAVLRGAGAPWVVGVCLCRARSTQPPG